ncbi:hypothetical protein [Absidia glauca]|uniref:ABC transporter domain-containing protein n=1 Tax=Absidia glauca TaxID=4829 RepID=A0A168TD26_ABSGL|nr:hypothetical protein [Absidia glauca]
MLTLKSNTHLLIRRLYSTHQQPLIQLKNATVQRFGAKKPVFQDLSLTIKPGQQWVIVGPVNAGKTTLAETLAGRHTAQPLASLQWPSQQDNSLYSADHVHLVSFKEDSGVFNYNQHYYQERFNFSDPDNDLTLRDYLGAHPLLDRVVNQLDLAHLLPLSFVKLSNGQTRRARIARDLTQKTGVILVSRPQDEFPTWATDVLVLDNGKIAWQGSPEGYLATTHHNDLAKERQEKDAYRTQALADEEARRADRPGVVELNNVNVVYSGQKILDDVTWTVKQGDRWALLGPNGSGKTTLLSFLTGDHPQAYANDLSLFGRRRGTGESIWEIKAKVGTVSPELHLYFNQAMTGRIAAGTGFFDVVVPRTLDSTQTATVESLFHEFGVSDCLDRALRDCSAAEQRLVLLIRSLVKRPPLLIWDEPYQGLDGGMISAVNNWLETYLRDDQTLILVTHHEDEIPRAVTRRFHLGPHGAPLTSP